MRVPIIAILLAIIIVLAVRTFSASSQQRVVDLPELSSCSCDSSYRCISDEEYMQLVVWNQENRWIVESYCEGC